MFLNKNNWEMIKSKVEKSDQPCIREKKQSSQFCLRPSMQIEIENIPAHFKNKITKILFFKRIHWPVHWCAKGLKRK